MKNKLITYFFILVAVSALWAFRGYEDKDSSEKIWLESNWPAKRQNYYIEIDLQGNFMSKEEKNKKIIIREGQIKKMYAKDFFRETKASEIMTKQNSDEAKMLFYKGETLKISAYINGELRHVEAPIKNFGDSFNFAFSQMKKEIFKFKPENKYLAFISAVPLTGRFLENFEKKDHKIEDLKVVEIKKLKSQKNIFNAISYPYRLIPLKTENDISEISEFINTEGLLGVKSLFYIGTTRGNFQCSVIEFQ